MTSPEAFEEEKVEGIAAEEVVEQGPEVIMNENHDSAVIASIGERVVAPITEDVPARKVADMLGDIKITNRPKGSRELRPTDSLKRIFRKKKPARRNEIQIPGGKDIVPMEDDIEEIPEADKAKIEKGLGNIGFFIEKWKNQGIAKALEAASSAIKDKESFSRRFLDSLAASSRQAEAKMDERIIGSQDINIKDLNNMGNAKSALSSGALLLGNATKYGTLAFAAPLRLVMSGGMAFAGLMDGAKEARLRSIEVLEQTRLEEDEAEEAAWALHAEAKKRVGVEKGAEPTAADLGQTYARELPKDIAARLAKSPLDENMSLKDMAEWVKNSKGESIPARAHFLVQKILRNDMKSGAAAFEKKIKKIEANDDLVPSEKQRRIDAICTSYKDRLRDYDRILTNTGTVDALAMGARYLGIAGRAVKGAAMAGSAGLAFERVTHFNLDELWNSLAKVFDRGDDREILDQVTVLAPHDTVNTIAAHAPSAVGSSVSNIREAFGIEPAPIAAMPEAPHLQVEMPEDTTLNPHTMRGIFGLEPQTPTMPPVHVEAADTTLKASTMSGVFGTNPIEHNLPPVQVEAPDTLKVTNMNEVFGKDPEDGATAFEKFKALFGFGKHTTLPTEAPAIYPQAPHSLTGEKLHGLFNEHPGKPPVPTELEPNTMKGLIEKYPSTDGAHYGTPLKVSNIHGVFPNATPAEIHTPLHEAAPIAGDPKLETPLSAKGAELKQMFAENPSKPPVPVELEPNTMKGLIEKYPSADGLHYGTPLKASNIHDVFPNATPAAIPHADIHHAGINYGPTAPEGYAANNVTIHEGDNAWKAAKAMVKGGTIDEKTFQADWNNPDSIVHTPSGDVHISHADLVHEGNVVKHVPGVDGKPGHFEIIESNGGQVGGSKELFDHYQKLGKDAPSWLTDKLDMPSIPSTDIDAPIFEDITNYKSFGELAETLPDRAANLEYVSDSFDNYSLFEQEQALRNLSQFEIDLDYIGNAGTSLGHELTGGQHELVERTQEMINDLNARFEETRTAFENKITGLGVKYAEYKKVLPPNMTVEKYLAAVKATGERTPLEAKVFGDDSPIQKWVKLLKPKRADFKTPLDTFLRMHFSK